MTQPPNKPRRCKRCGASLAGWTLASVCPRCMLNSTAATGRRQGILSENPAPPGKASDLAFGDYVLEEEIAHGGMGVIYRARQLSLNRTVAIKLLLLGRYSSAESIERFATNADSLAQQIGECRERLLYKPLDILDAIVIGMVYCLTCPSKEAAEEAWEDFAEQVTYGIDELESVTQEKRDLLLGIAYFIRALSYHSLVKIYAYEPGREVNGWNAGVVLRTEPTWDETDAMDGRPRATNLEVYDQIVSDLEQAIELHSPIPVEGTVSITDKITGIWDKGKGAVIETEATAVDKASGEPLFTNRSAVFIRGAGGFGGERGPSGARNVPPDKAPDHEVTYRTRADQALTYRLSGDRNPLHSDPEFAKAAGFPKAQIFQWAYRVAVHVAELRNSGRSVPPWLSLQHSLASRLVYSKIAQRLGGREPAVGEPDQGSIPIRLQPRMKKNSVMM